MRRKSTAKKEAVIDDTLPVVTLTKNGTIVDVNAIALEWAPIDDQRVKGIYVYRVNVDAIATSSSDEYYDTVESRFSTHYLDTKIEPSSKYRVFLPIHGHHPDYLSGNGRT